MRGREVLQVKESQSLAEDLRFMVFLNSKTLPCMETPETAFEQSQDFIVLHQHHRLNRQLPLLPCLYNRISASFLRNLQEPAQAQLRPARGPHDRRTLVGKLLHKFDYRRRTDLVPIVQGGGYYNCSNIGRAIGRPGRGPLDALSVTITRRKVNHTLDVDVRDFFGSVNHG
jgi:hypothetical protein